LNNKLEENSGDTVFIIFWQNITLTIFVFSLKSKIESAVK